MRARGGAAARLLAPVLLAAVAGCFSDRPDGGMGPTDGEAVVVQMNANLTFEPAVASIRTGQTVVWRNASSFVHTSTADPARANDPAHVRLPEGAATWNSGDVPAGGEFRKTFDVAGEYAYFCIPHETQGMLGQVIVEN
ncbi:MAG: plastocyanin [Gemmatimonadetes bacterium]|nr:plastocyanin [Gemmatimonadota bacterium]